MKNFIFLLFILNVSYSFSQEIDSEAPANPDFLKYRNNLKSGVFPGITTDGKINAEIPFNVLPNFDYYLSSTGNKNIMFDTLYDMRPLGILTSVKNQGSCGSCWTHAAMGSIESYWMKNGFGNFNLSEQNLRTCSGFMLDTTLGTCTGGNAKKAGAYLCRRSGPILETDDVYDTNPNSGCDSVLTPIAFVDKYMIFPGTASIIKQALLDYGGLYTNMYYDGLYYNSSNKTYYYSGTNATNHAVLLVGWNDNKITAGGTGAWIIKNSYGSSYGESGYFYVSYNDARILTTNACFPDHQLYNPDEKIYMYDDLGWISSYGYTAETAYALVKYTATENLWMTKVGTFINTAGGTVDFEIYDNKSGNTLSGLLGSLPTQTSTMPGYSYFPLNTPIAISAGNDFYIKVKYTTPGYNYPIPVEKLSADYANPFIEDNVCWASSTGTTWTAYGASLVGKERDLCIRAYTLPNNTIVDEYKNLTESIEIYPNPVTSGLLNIKSENSDIIKIEVLSAKSEILQTQSYINKRKVSVDLENYPKAIYFIKIYSKNGVVVKKIIL